MQRLVLLSVMVIALFFCAQSSFAAKVCLQDNFGAFWELKGGKIDKKSYTVKRIPASSSCVSPGYADVTQTITGTLLTGTLTSHNTTGACVPVLWHMTTNAAFNGSGSYDQLGDGTIDGNFTISQVSCTLFPALTEPSKSTGKANVNDPAIAKQ